MLAEILEDTGTAAGESHRDVSDHNYLERTKSWRGPLLAGSRAGAAAGWAGGNGECAAKLLYSARDPCAMFVTDSGQ